MMWSGSVFTWRRYDEPCVRSDIVCLQTSNFRKRIPYENAPVYISPLCFFPFCQCIFFLCSTPENKTSLPGIEQGNDINCIMHCLRCSQILWTFELSDISMLSWDHCHFLIDMYVHLCTTVPGLVFTVDILKETKANWQQLASSIQCMWICGDRVQHCFAMHVKIPRGPYSDALLSKGIPHWKEIHLYTKQGLRSLTC